MPYDYTAAEALEDLVNHTPYFFYGQDTIRTVLRRKCAPKTLQEMLICLYQHISNCETEKDDLLQTFKTAFGANAYNPLIEHFSMPHYGFDQERLFQAILKVCGRNIVAQHPYTALKLGISIMICIFCATVTACSFAIAFGELPGTIVLSAIGTIPGLAALATLGGPGGLFGILAFATIITAISLVVYGIGLLMIAHITEKHFPELSSLEKQSILQKNILSQSTPKAQALSAPPQLTPKSSILLTPPSKQNHYSFSKPKNSPAPSGRTSPVHRKTESELLFSSNQIDTEINVETGEASSLPLFQQTFPVIQRKEKVQCGGSICTPC